MADATFWDGIAEKYAKQPVANVESFERKIALTRELMSPNDVVLSVGCGTGSLSLRLADTGAELHGLDVSKEMIRIARGKAGEVSNVTFHVGAFEDFTVLEPGSVSGICAYSILHLVGDRAATLQKMYRLLAPGGFLVTSTAVLGESFVPYTPVLAMMRWLGKAPSVSVVSKKTLRAEIHAAGFADIQEPDVATNATTAFMIARKP